MSFRGSTYINIVVFYGIGVMSQEGNELIASEYEDGSEIVLQCPSLSQKISNIVQWDTSIFFKCYETDSLPVIHYNRDGNFYCGVEIVDQEMFNRIAYMLEMHEPWRCRVPMSKGVGIDNPPTYIPMPIPLWGAVSTNKKHLLVSTHMNVVVHGGKGEIHGVSMYPTSEHFQYIELGGLLNFHGPIKWFSQRDFTPLRDIELSREYCDDQNSFKKDQSFDDSNVTRFASTWMSIVLYSMLIVLFGVILYQMHKRKSIKSLKNI